MNHAHQPVWAGSRTSLLAIWVAAGESPEWIAARTDALLRQLQAAFDVPQWDMPTGDRWEGSPEDLAEIVRRNPVQEMVSGDQIGDPIAGEGYSFTVSGVGPRVAPLVRVAAGNVAVGRRMPRRRLTVELRETVAGGVTSDAADTVCAAVAETWKPAAAEFADLAVRRLARRGNWKIGIGYRTWISAEVGVISRVAEGLSAAELSGGTLISAPDDWSAEQVVAAMTETLAANGLDEVPH
ncbi:hypothetical protein GO011_11660 [Mycobacterium sp. 20091114027_K0903767]|nr:hypothetical protein [Mycobacterium sp. 20091114027_K0903767]